MIMKKSVFSLIIFSILWLLTSCKLLEQQELKLNSLFSNHMVLHKSKMLLFGEPIHQMEKL